MKTAVTLGLIVTLAITASAASATQNCPTLSDLGINQLSSANAQLPFWTPSSAHCTQVPSGGHCYVTWNLGQENAASGWQFFLEVGALSPSKALDAANQSNIFTATGISHEDPREQWCTASAGSVTVSYFSQPYPSPITANSTAKAATQHNWTQ